MNAQEAIKKVIVAEYPQVLVEVDNGNAGLNIEVELPEAEKTEVSMFSDILEIVKQFVDGLKVETVMVNSRIMIATVYPMVNE
jgi:hypothetical protein